MTGPILPPARVWQQLAREVALTIVFWLGGVAVLTLAVKITVGVVRVAWGLW